LEAYRQASSDYSLRIHTGVYSGEKRRRGGWPRCWYEDNTTRYTIQWSVLLLV